MGPSAAGGGDGGARGRGGGGRRRGDRGCGGLAEEAWTAIDVRDGDTGPLVVEATKVLVRAKTAPGKGYDEMLIVIRERQSDGSMKHDYYLSNAPPDTPLAE